MIKAVVFDLDGTLLNTLDDLKESTNFALRKFNYPERTLEEVRCFVGNGVRKLIERAVPEDCKNIDECLEVFKNNYSENMYNHTQAYNGILKILEELHKDKVKIGVVSNKFDSAVKDLCKKYFGDLVDTAIGQNDDVPKKPAPDGVLKAMKILGSDKNSTIYAGDSDVDIQTAKNAGLKCIGVTWGFRTKDYLKGADFIVDSPDEILKIVRSL